VENDNESHARSHSFTAPFQVLGGLAASDSEKAEALADSLQAQF
jgi:hypothetical protein